MSTIQTLTYVNSLEIQAQLFPVFLWVVSQLQRLFLLSQLLSSTFIRAQQLYIMGYLVDLLTADKILLLNCLRGLLLLLLEPVDGQILIQWEFTQLHSVLLH